MASQDYFARVKDSSKAHPLTPAAEGPGSVRADVQKKNLRASTMVSNSVNKTALHPGGVQYVTYCYEILQNLTD
jgi:hypothetical protein